MNAVHALLAFNRGLVSSTSLARVDVKRMALSAEEQTNWMPRALGPMMIRPGLGYLGSTRSDAASKFIEFVYSASDTALVELTDSTMRVWISDAVVQRPAITSTFFRWNGASWDTSSDTSSLFTNSTDVGYWKDNDETGCTSAFATGGYLSLTGNDTASAIRDRKVDVTETSTEHSINIVINRGKVICRIGSTEGGDEYLTDRTLRAGYHSLSVTPTGDFFIRLSNSATVASLVDSVSIGQAAADMTLTTPWTASDLDNVRWTRINDVIFVACDGRQPKRIERQGSDSPRSWSVVEYAPEDGPFRDLNTGPVRLKGSALTGDITLTAERNFFKSTNVGSLFALTSAGQEVTRRIQADNTFTDHIRVTGIDASRVFTIDLDGPTFTATTTVTLQRSVAEPGDWTDVNNYTATTTVTLDDGLDNQIIYYRIGIKTGNYTAADDITATLTYSAGSITGIVRATAYTSETVMSAQVLVALGKADQYTQDWREGDWSDRRGYPSAVFEDGGRLCWAGKGFYWGSIPDLLDSFDDTQEGDSAPIRRSLGEGATDRVNWALSVNNPVLGLESTVRVARSSSLDEPLTQAKFSIKPIGDMGSSSVPAIRMDSSAIFTGGNESRVYEAAIEAGSYNYATPTDLTALVPEIGNSRFVRRAFQRYPDRRLHLVRADGTVACLVFDKLENVTCWVEIETDGTIEDVVVLPGASGARLEDRVYYVVNRTINGSTKRYLEKWALESQCIGAADNRLADSFVTGTGSGTAVSGLSHLEGETVCLWGNGKDLGTYTVASGAITASASLSGAYTVGLVYTATYKSGKRAVADWQQLMLSMRKKVDRLGFVLANTHYQGLEYGRDFTTMDNLPLIEAGKETTADTIHSALETDPITFPGDWGTDPRVCLKATAPKPCTVMAVALMEQAQ